jgi:hypothetical protein
VVVVVPLGIGLREIDHLAMDREIDLKDEVLAEDHAKRTPVDRTPVGKAEDEASRGFVVRCARGNEAQGGRIPASHLR